ncbi:MAG: tRNA 2-thiouridine(34) synthase MnmA [Anaerolineales bacterium]|nr:tRNA 2-thiouridine(34) synthase MnmA [Anaerolineales bacterium]
MPSNLRVVIAMSGGVDSSVAAALLVEQGYQVIGMMLRLWSEAGHEDENRCCTPDAMVQARSVAAILGIPFYAIDAQKIFRDTVVQSFIDGYRRGDTPNPCLVCNRLVRWGNLYARARALDAEFLATGHYARIQQDQEGCYQLVKGVDPTKDQSYVLYMLNQEQLSHTLLPLGSLTKAQVRQLARQYNLPVAEQSESQDLCFLASEDYRSFLARHAPEVYQPGPIINRQGETLGNHNGLAHFTIGQRKGLGLSSREPLYVLEKDLSQNALIVGVQEELGGLEFTAGDINWTTGTAPDGPIRAQVKIRYKGREVWAEVIPLQDRSACVILDHPLRDITPGQAAVFYHGDIVLGGGIIQA